MKKVHDRLQGETWHTMKDKLIPISYSKSLNGHVRGIYKDPRTGFIYSHWLNDEEIEELKKNLVEVK